MHVSIIIPASNGTAPSITVILKILTSVNRYLIATGQQTESFFNIDLVGIKKETDFEAGHIIIKPTKMIDEVSKTDLIILTSIVWDEHGGEEENLPFVPWIRKMHLERGAVLASICPASYLIAKSGLIDETGCSTHWAYADSFEKRFPKIPLIPYRIITHHSAIYTSGGLLSGMILIVHLIEKYAGKNAANWTAKMFELDAVRESLSRFITLEGQRNHEDVLIQQIQDFLEENYQDKLQISTISKKFSLSNRNLVRRFKKATQNTPLQYLQRIKIEAAKRLLEQTNHSIPEIMNNIGYSDIKAFRLIFKKLVGFSPSIYRSKYGRAQKSAQ